MKFMFDDASQNKWSAIAYEAHTEYGNAGNLQFYVDGNNNSSPLMTLTNTGNISASGAIFTNSHITASGNISASGTVFAAQFNDNGTNLNVPDYVFESEYKLKTLNEVEQHISQYKHLPNIPSMDDIKAWSELSYGDRDMKLLEKIEELTLYVIDLQKQIDELKKE